jgi:hypothetical protein
MTALDDQWDDALERVTAALVRLAGGREAGSIAVHAGGWATEFRLTRRTVTVYLAPNAAGESLTDYQLAIVYGLQFHALREWPPPTAFAKNLTIKEGYRWDEQMLREVALEALAIVRLTLSHDPPAAPAIHEDIQAPPRMASVAGKLKRKKGRR